jgi:hypothetical protein
MKHCVVDLYHTCSKINLVVKTGPALRGKDIHYIHIGKLSSEASKVKAKIQVFGMRHCGPLQRLSELEVMSIL